MAIKLRAKDTQHVVAALEAYREQMLNIPGDGPSPYIDSVVADVGRLLTSYRRSFKKLVEIGRW
jgi:hypothetical protein